MANLRYEWTPVSELPDDDRNILFWTEERDFYAGSYWAEYGGWLTIEGTPLRDWEKVTHWKDVEPPSGTNPG